MFCDIPTKTFHKIVMGMGEDDENIKLVTCDNPNDLIEKMMPHGFRHVQAVPRRQASGQSFNCSLQEEARNDPGSKEHRQRPEAQANKWASKS